MIFGCKRLLIQSVLLLMALQTASANPPDCPEGPFATTPNSQPATISSNEIQQLSQLDRAIPAEIERIHNGVVAFYQGAFINDGLISWYGYDADRALFIAVLGKAGPKLQQLPDQQRLTPNQFIRHTQAAGYARGEFVTLQQATSSQQGELACQMNRAFTLPPNNPPRQPPTDMLQFSVSLIHQGRSTEIQEQTMADALRQLLSYPLQTAIQHAYGN